MIDPYDGKRPSLKITRSPARSGKVKVLFHRDDLVDFKPVHQVDLLANMVKCKISKGSKIDRRLKLKHPPKSGQGMKITYLRSFE